MKAVTHADGELVHSGLGPSVLWLDVVDETWRQVDEAEWFYKQQNDQDEKLKTDR